MLSSGRHSDVYFEKFRILEQPEVLSALCTEIAGRFRTDTEFVAGPLTGGIIIAFDVARQMNVQALYVETENGDKKLRRGKSLVPGSRVLVVDDVLTTGLSVRETITAIQNAGGEVIGVGVLIDRSEQPQDFGCPFFAAHRVEAKSYPENDIPEWLSAIPIQKPGTRA